MFSGTAVCIVLYNNKNIYSSGMDGCVSDQLVIM